METSARQQLLDSFLTASHGDLAGLTSQHSRALDKDAALYLPLSRWYEKYGTLRDHHELFPAHLLSSPEEDFRHHGQVLVQKLRPYQLARVVRYSKEQLHKSTRSLRSAVQFYLRRREADELWFDECVLRDRRSMRYLYSTLHLPPGERAQKVLFEEDPPADSRLLVVRQLQRLQHDPAAQAELIRRHRIQFTTALGASGPLRPVLLEALVEVMTPQQLMNHLGFLQKRGALGKSKIRSLVKEKLEAGKVESRVHDSKGLRLIGSLSDDPELLQQVIEMSQHRLRQRGRLTRPTLMLVDKSGSMEECIGLGKMLGCLCSTIAEAPLWVEAFDGASFTITAKGSQYLDWEQAFRHIRADGCTSLGAPLRKMARCEYEQIVLISDGEENTDPYFIPQLQAYERARGRRVEVFWIKVGGGAHEFEQQLTRAKVICKIFPFRGDYYNLPNLVAMLCQEQATTDSSGLLDQILATPIYQLDDLNRLPAGFCPETFEIL
jgi:hypothetical protein